MSNMGITLPKKIHEKELNRKRLGRSSLMEQKNNLLSRRIVREKSREEEIELIYSFPSTANKYSVFQW